MEVTAGRGRSKAPIVIVAAMLLCGALAGLAARPAYAHQNDVDSVNVAGGIRYRVYSEYGDEIRFARDTWNGVGRIDIRWVSNTSLHDLEYRTFNTSGYTWVGLWVPDPSKPDGIFFNKYNFDAYGYTNFDRRGTANHEVGHALGLLHPIERGEGTPEQQDYWENSSIMYWQTREFFNSPRQHDINDYHIRWG
jgi:hypothetical protein